MEDQDALDSPEEMENEYQIWQCLRHTNCDCCEKAALEIRRLRSMLRHIAEQDFDSGYTSENFARFALDPKFDEGDVI